MDSLQIFKTLKAGIRRPAQAVYQYDYGNNKEIQVYKKANEKFVIDNNLLKHGYSVNTNGDVVYNPKTATKLVWLHKANGSWEIIFEK